LLYVAEKTRTDEQAEKISGWKARYRDLLEARILVRKLDDHLEQAAAIKEISSRDPIFWTNAFGVITTARNAARGAPVTLPFLLYPFQVDLATWLMDGLREGRTRLVLKSRELGVTWLAENLIVWAWLFIPGFSCRIGSRTAQLVDANPGSRIDTTLFGRIEIILENLPEYMLPAGFDIANKRYRQKNMLINPENGNTIIGEASSPNFSRQSRHTLIFLDEFDFWPDAESVFTSSHAAAHARWIVTTPNPFGQNMAKKIVDEKLADVFEAPWYLHPERDLEWRLNQDKILTKDRAAQEYDLSFTAFSDLRIYPEWDSVPKGTFPYHPGWPVYGSVDFGRADGTALVYAQRNPATGRIRILGAYYRAGKTIDWFFPFFGKEIKSGIHDYDPEDLEFIKNVHLWTRKGITWYGDPSGSQLTQAADRSVIQQLADNKIYVTTNPSINRYHERQTRTKLAMRSMEVNIEHARPLDQAMRDYRRARPTSNLKDPSALLKPVHNWASHPATALEFLVVNLPPLESYAASPPPVRHHAAWENL